MNFYSGILTVILGVSLLVADIASAQTAPSEPDTVGLANDEDSWLNKTINRYFGSNPASDGDLGGRAIDLVDRYSQYEGRPIAVVIVHQVERFSSGSAESAAGDSGSLGALAKKFQTHTRQKTIRQYLLFDAGQLVDPFTMADSEQMLRGLDFIDDVRILLVPLSGGDKSVAIVVETRDRFPLGATFKLIDVGRYDVGLYSSNVAGRGVRFDNQLIFRDDREPNLGYGGGLIFDNVGGTFFGGTALYEDSYRRLQKGVSITRELIHPSIQWVGGAGFVRTRERDAGPEPDDAEVSDVWAGYVVPLRERSAAVTTARPLLVPAFSFTRKTYLDRPVVSRDTLSRFHNSQNYLFGLAFQRLKNYKTNYLFEMGETENFPSGTIVKLSPGYQDGEFHDRGMGFFQAAYYGTRNRGDVLFGQLDFGGFFRRGDYEDGSLFVRSAYISPLLGHEAWKSRIYVAFSYALAINRVSDTVLRLGDTTGLRGMADNLVKGNQRTVANFEYRLFTPWQLLGFRIMLLGFADVGTVTGSHDPVFEQKIYTSIGLAVRIQNPNLVLPATQLRVAFLNGIEDKGIVFGFELGGFSSDLVRVPGTRPGSFTFR